MILAADIVKPQKEGVAGDGKGAEHRPPVEKDCLRNMLKVDIIERANEVFVAPHRL